MTIQAIIFDFDGLILDTEGPIYRSWLELYEQHGQALPVSAWAELIGTMEMPWHPLTELEKRLERRLEEALVAARNQREDDLIALQPARPGVEAVLAAAKRLGLKIGLASSSDRAWVVRHLTRLGLLDYFDCLRTFDDVSRTKPDPELYLAALDCLGVPPEKAFALEDSPMGVKAAKSAGLFCVAVPNDLTRQLPLEEADLRLESLDGISLEELLQRMGKNGHA
jgi:HAD superfamily hydrolase (TIGR01509 family)